MVSWPERPPEAQILAPAGTRWLTSTMAAVSEESFL